MLAKVYLTQGSNYDKVVDLCKQVTALGYDLTKCKYADNFDATVNNGPESIFEIQYTGSTNYDFWNNDNQASWPPQSGKVAVIAKKMEDRQIVHLVNFANAAHFEWRDTNGTQTTPNTIYDIALSVNTTQAVKNVWVASPDWNEGVATSVEFKQNLSKVSFTLPYLKYWSTIVLEYK